MLIGVKTSMLFPVYIVVVALLACFAALCHWIYCARRRPTVREFIDGIKPLMRSPFDQTSLVAAILGDIGILVFIYLLATVPR